MCEHEVLGGALDYPVILVKNIKRLDLPKLFIGERISGELRARNKTGLIDRLFGRRLLLPRVVESEFLETDKEQVVNNGYIFSKNYNYYHREELAAVFNGTYSQCKDVTPEVIALDRDNVFKYYFDWLNLIKDKPLLREEFRRRHETHFRQGGNFYSIGVPRVDQNPGDHDIYFFIKSKEDSDSSYKVCDLGIITVEGKLNEVRI